jgi:hypothetical protein
MALPARRCLRSAVRLACVLAVVSVMTGCARMGFKSAACREPAIPAQPGNNPPLKVSAGLDAPDTRNAVKVPALSEPEKPRGSDAPCLSRPPAYGG